MRVEYDVEREATLLLGQRLPGCATTGRDAPSRGVPQTRCGVGLGTDPPELITLDAD